MKLDWDQAWGEAYLQKKKDRLKIKLTLVLFFRNHAARGEWMKWSTKKITSLKF